MSSIRLALRQLFVWAKAFKGFYQLWCWLFLNPGTSCRNSIFNRNGFFAVLFTTAVFKNSLPRFVLVHTRAHLLPVLSKLFISDKNFFSSLFKKRYFRFEMSLLVISAVVFHIFTWAYAAWSCFAELLKTFWSFITKKTEAAVCKTPKCQCQNLWPHVCLMDIKIYVPVFFSFLLFFFFSGGNNWQHRAECIPVSGSHYSGEGGD